MVDYADSVQPFETEGGFMVGEIAVMYAYSRNINTATGKFL